MSKYSGAGTAKAVPPLQKKLLDRMAQPCATQTVVSRLLQEDSGRSEEKKDEEDRIRELEKRLKETEEELLKAQNRIAFQARCVEELKAVLRTGGTQRKGERGNMPRMDWRLLPVAFVTGAAVLLIEHGIGVLGLLGML
ncbi:MAG: hypothetical protein HFE84_09595 [Lachnospiraceae bacterium]|nr:hypothetical protein [Lachnospiraceae bacterium]